ncbi:MAG: NAD-glutamate dehydrogenase domain-containing protein, partial [Propionibacteriaceae bacterium]
AAYKIFINTLLSVTDNVVKGEIVHPTNVVFWDNDDPYLVVAADKGTATFSDIANGISLERGHWLGDAFASGGSIGYDHKGMGITARGAWESVKRHFAELGKDCQNEDFTVVGIGDMAGDVFGNGALLSEHGKWIAIFNHLHIFLDPTPNVAASFAERQRMFDNRLGWDQYNKELISAGGGIFERSAKSIPLSAEIKAALGIDPSIESMSPTELIHNILLAPVELIYNGGIGTYLKSTTESHAQASDKANDATRVNGNELRCKIFGEGGNLGCTQLGRVEAAEHGIKINTDFIDNSAGVDTSDHEVNIKILFAQEIEAGKTTIEARNELIPQMTDEVRDLVLAHNVAQNKALQNENVKAAELAGEHEEWMKFLEGKGYMDRKVQFMPTTAEMEARIAQGKGLTNPEFCTLLSWTKIYFEDAILECSILDDPAFAARLTNYFPTLLREKFAEAMPKHRLRREIVATELVNEFVDTMGITAFQRVTKATGKDLDAILHAFFAAKGEVGFDADAPAEQRVAQAAKIEAAMK